jgi:uncharacterized damage-inducible protein DinB
MIKEILLQQYDRCYNENGWFVAARNAIEGLNVEQAAWKPVDDVNCIWETLSHITYYNYAYLQRFKGLQYEYDVSNNDQTFSTGEYDETHWRADVNQFDSVMNEWRDLIAASDETKFSQRVSDENPASWAELIANVNAHNAYHAGQILLLRKMQGSWDREKGVS